MNNPEAHRCGSCRWFCLISMDMGGNHGGTCHRHPQAFWESRNTAGVNAFAGTGCLAYTPNHPRWGAPPAHTPPDQSVGENPSPTATHRLIAAVRRLCDELDLIWIREDASRQFVNDAVEAVQEALKAAEKGNSQP